MSKILIHAKFQFFLIFSEWHPCECTAKNGKFPYQFLPDDIFRFEQWMEKPVSQTAPIFSWSICKKWQVMQMNVKYRINIGDHASINQRAYWVLSAERCIIREEVQKCLMKVLFNHLKVPFCSAHKEKSWHFCVDYN